MAAVLVVLAQPLLPCRRSAHCHLRSRRGGRTELVSLCVCIMTCAEVCACLFDLEWRERVGLVLHIDVHRSCSACVAAAGHLTV